MLQAARRRKALQEGRCRPRSRRAVAWRAEDGPV